MLLSDFLNFSDQDGAENDAGTPDINTDNTTPSVNGVIVNPFPHLVEHQVQTFEDSEYPFLKSAQLLR